mgnify:CR=1 FL=1
MLARLFSVDGPNIDNLPRRRDKMRSHDLEQKRNRIEDRLIDMIDKRRQPVMVNQYEQRGENTGSENQRPETGAIQPASNN